MLRMTAMNTRLTPYGQEVSPAHREDQLPGGAVFAIVFTAFAFLLFGFPWVIVAVSHFAGNF